MMRRFFIKNHLKYKMISSEIPNESLEASISSNVSIKKSFLKTVTTVIVTTVMLFGCNWMQF